MAEDEPREAEEKSDRLGYESLAMNVVAASTTEEPSQTGRRRGGLVLLLVAVLVGAGVITWGARVASNLHPGKEAENRLLAKVRELPAFKMGTVLGARYAAGNRVIVEFSSGVSTMDAAQRDQLRQAAVSVLKTMIEERPNRDLYLDGYQGDTQTVRAEYRHKSTLVSRNGRPELDIVVWVEGDPEGGIGEMVEPSRRVGGRL